MPTLLGGGDVGHTGVLSYLFVGSHVLQELAKDRQGEGQILNPERRETLQAFRGVLSCVFWLAAINVPTDQNVHRILKNITKVT